MPSNSSTIRPVGWIVGAGPWMLAQVAIFASIAWAIVSDSSTHSESTDVALIWVRGIAFLSATVISTPFLFGACLSQRIWLWTYTPEMSRRWAWFVAIANGGVGVFLTYWTLLGSGSRSV